MRLSLQKLLNIAKVIDAINEWIGRFAYWIILLMIFIGVWNVVGRYVGRFLGYSLTSNALIEIQWYLFDIVFFLHRCSNIIFINLLVRMKTLHQKRNLIEV